MRKSIFTFLQNFHHLSTIPTLLLLPFAARLHSVLLTTGIPPQSNLFTTLNLKLTQTILSSTLSLPFSLSSLLLAKAAVVRLLHHHHYKHSLTSTLSRLIFTHICNSLLFLSATAAMLSLSSPRFRLLFSAAGVIAYSIALASVYAIFGLTLIIAAAADDSGGGGGDGWISSIVEARVLIRGRSSAALSLAAAMNVALAAVEALFQYRVINAYGRDAAVTPAMVLEAAVVAYFYAIVVIVDTIVGYVFLKRCREEQCDFCHQRIEFCKQVKELDLVV
ncbi:hypothetical protein SASPL_124969 [Salvia splendens]|uniref:Uncharacterized protein n=2 Tax=Salvia splendens TaxID=180675 RepID=A0A8X8XGA4_SALSN|nr:hypothetical protein SASPL_124969 [Salvia splendens]